MGELHSLRGAIVAFPPRRPQPRDLTWRRDFQARLPKSRHQRIAFRLGLVAAARGVPCPNVIGWDQDAVHRGYVWGHKIRAAHLDVNWGPH